MATRRFAPVAKWLSELKVESAILDGEIAVPDERGVTHIDLLSFAARHAPERLAYYAFDLLWLDGRDLRRRPLLERKAILEKLLARAPGRVVCSDHFAGDGSVLFQQIGELGCEGIVSKRADAPYTSGPSSTWVKVKHAAVGTFPVIGYATHGRRIEALLLAEESGRGLRPVGRVEFWRAGVLDDDAREALAFLTRHRRAFARALDAASTGPSLGCSRPSGTSEGARGRSAPACSRGSMSMVQMSESEFRP